MEYEVANGGVLYNLGERKANILMSRDSQTPFFMSFQVVKVHKPLLAVSKLIEAGNNVIFNKDDPHILLSTGQKLPMVCNGGTYEVEVWIERLFRLFVLHQLDPEEEAATTDVPHMRMFSKLILQGLV